MDNKKYELTNETINVDGHILHRIKALINFGNVKAGDLGGFIEKEYNLDHNGNCWVYRNAKVYNNARIYDDAMVYDNCWIYGNAIISGDARVCGFAEVFGNARVYDNAMVCRTAKVYGHTKVFGNTKLSNNAYISNSNDYITIGPIGSRNDYTTFYLDKDKNIHVSCDLAEVFGNARLSDNTNLYSNESKNNISENSTMYLYKIILMPLSVKNDYCNEFYLTSSNIFEDLKDIDIGDIKSIEKIQSINTIDDIKQSIR